MTVAEPQDLLHCTFCTKSQQVVRKLIAGPGIYICDDCVALCNAILDEEIAEDPLGLGQLRHLVARTDALVERLRDRGVPWDEIAEALRSPEET